MRIFKFLGARVLAVALAFSVIPAAVPSNVPIVGSALGIQKAEAGGRYYGNRRYYRGGRDYRGGRHYGGRRGYYGGRDYRGGRHYGGRRYYGRRNNGGAAIAGAIVGLGIGAAIANSNRPRYYSGGGSYAYRSPEWYDYCASRYRSFDPRSGTYQPYNGPRQICR